MVLTFTIDSSVKVLDYYFDKCLWLSCALRVSILIEGFHASFGDIWS